MDVAKKGSLIVVGSGIELVRDTTIGARLEIEQADKVLILVTDPASELWIRRLNSTVESLFDCYIDGRPRLEAYKKMVERMLKNVRDGLNVCAVFYGHPGVFVQPSHEAIRIARLEGYSAHMLPGISAEDCLFADLGLDPGIHGCQSFEATDFLVRRRKFDPKSPLILWQIGTIGDLYYHKNSYNLETALHGLYILRQALEKHYDKDHEVIIYQASHFPLCQPNIQRVPLAKIQEANVSAASTMYIPESDPQTLDEDIIHQLGMVRLRNT
jgi:Tetrapyrrole (Corrin/Porphyrin) Methylases